MSRAGFDTLNNILEEIKANLPFEGEEILEAFRIMSDEGLMMNLSMILSKLRNDLMSPLLVSEILC
jgi:hypothetical protein